MAFELIDGRQIRRENLDPNQYVLSLLKEGIRAGLLDKHALYTIQEKIISVLKDLIMRYTKGESASVKTETAEAILSSIYYAMDACVSRLNSPEEGLALLKSASINVIHEKGIGIVKSYVEETKERYREMRRNKPDVPQEIYNSTVLEALPGFFRDYNMMFNAHDTTASIDYPLVFDDMSVRGIFYIRNYIENIDIENRFCRCFGQEAVIRLLENYGRVYQINYKESPYNFFEVVINNAIFSVLLGINADNLVISRFQYEILESKLGSLGAVKTGAVIEDAVGRVIEDLGISEPKLIAYLHRYKVLFIKRLVNAVENKSLRHFIITEEKTAGQDINHILMAGNRLSDARFRSIVRNISESESIAGKVGIIRTNLHSLEDFVDVLNAECLYGNEYKAVFDALGEMELAVLCKLVPLEDEMEKEWQDLFRQFIQGLGAERRSAIESRMQSL